MQCSILLAHHAPSRLFGAQDAEAPIHCLCMHPLGAKDPRTSGTPDVSADLRSQLLVKVWTCCAQIAATTGSNAANTLLQLL